MKKAKKAKKCHFERANFGSSTHHVYVNRKENQIFSFELNSLCRWEQHLLFSNLNLHIGVWNWEMKRQNWVNILRVNHLYLEKKWKIWFERRRKRKRKTKNEKRKTKTKNENMVNENMVNSWYIYIIIIVNWYFKNLKTLFLYK